MTLEGKLRQFKLTEILELISLNQKTGVLTVNSQKNRLRVQFKDGFISYLDYNDVSLEELTLHAIIQKKDITQNRYKELKQLAEASRSTIFDILASEGVIQNRKLPEYFKKRVESLIYKILCWNEGHFNFQQTDEKIGYLKWELRIPVSPLLHEGIRRQDEMEHMKGSLPEMDVTLHLNPSHPPLENLTPLQVQILMLIDGDRTVKDILNETHKSSFDINKQIIDLMKRDIIISGKSRSSIEQLWRKISDRTFARYIIMVMGGFTLLIYLLLLVKILLNFF